MSYGERGTTGGRRTETSKHLSFFLQREETRNTACFPNILCLLFSSQFFKESQWIIIKKQTKTKWTSAFKSYRCNAEQERAGMLRIMLQWMCACGGQCRSQWGGEEAHTNTCKHTKERLTGTCRTGMREECQLTSPPLSCPSQAAPRLLCRRPQWRLQLRGLHADSQWNSGSVWHINHPCGIFFFYYYYLC